MRAVQSKYLLNINLKNHIMKKKLLFLAGCAAMLIAGCTNDPFDEGHVSMTGAPQIRINGNISQEYTTRVDDGGFCNGDQIGLFGVNYTDDNTVAGTLVDEGNQVDNARYTYNEESHEWSSAGGVYYKDAETNIDLYAYYPYAAVDNVGAYKFEVAQDQSGENALDGYGASDFLWALAENVAPTDQKIHLAFSHRLACANVVLVEGKGFDEGEWDSLSKGVLVMNTSRTADIDLSTGEATVTGEPAREGIVMKSNAEGFRAIVVPQSVDADVALFAITVDGLTYRFKLGETCTYLAGKQSNFTITINKKSHSGEYELELVDTEIIDWIADVDSHGGDARQYYVVHCDEPGTLEAKIKADGKNPAKIKNLKVSGYIDRRDFDFMRDKMTILQAINLKESEIGSWRYYVVVDGADAHYEYFSGEMPETDDECQAKVIARYPDRYIEWYNREVYSYAHEIPAYVFEGKISLVHFVFPEKVTKIGSEAFRGTLLSGALIIPDDVTLIGSWAFNNTNITSLHLPKNLKSIGEGAFQKCRSLSGDISLPESLESIEQYAFEDCGMLSGHLTIPSKITTISDKCFYCCSNLDGLTLHDGITSIGKYAFGQCANMKGMLTLPEGLKSIAMYAFWKTPFQGELTIPKQIQVLDMYSFNSTGFSSIKFAEDSELIKIGQGAFAYCLRVSEPIVLPEGLITIENTALSECRNLPSVIIPSTVAVIGGDAFRGCSGLTSIQCDATMPPVVGSGAFNGVAKDNFTLEVPEASVARYQTANGWSDFKRIGAHHDFSISRKHLRTLNAETSQAYILRAPAGAAWSVESKPEWVTVTPSSGVGQQEVVVTVAAMADGDVATFTREEMTTNGNWKTETHAGRGGEIVFLYNEKDYRAKMAVEQYDCDNYDTEVIVNQAATTGEGVNIVFMADCFDARDIAMGKYTQAVDEAIGYYFAIEPYKHYCDHFNVYTVVGMSLDSGMGTVNTIKDAKFGSQYSLGGIAPDTQITYEYAMKAPTVNEENLCETLVVLVENTEDYGGICYMWGDGSAIACCPMSRDAYPFDFRGIVQHEAGGHGFAKLADEYIYTNAFIQSCSCNNKHLDSFNAGKALGWYRNLSTNGNHKTVEWAHLFAHPDYSGIVDMYEGGYFHTRGIYRSEGNSCMNNNVPYYSAISRQEMVERIMRYGGQEFDINEFYANDVRDASNNDFTTSAVRRTMSTAVEMSGASKQIAPKYMGAKPQLR